MSANRQTCFRSGAHAGPRVVFAPARARCAAVAFVLLSGVPVVTGAQPHSTVDVRAEQARVDSLNRAVIFSSVVPLAPGTHVADVAFAAVGRNVVTPVEIAWVLADSVAEMVAVAARPMAGTADAGEELGRRAAGVLHRPIAMHSTQTGSWVLERSGRLLVLSGAQVDSCRLDLGGHAPRDLAVSNSGLVHVLTDRDVRVWPARDGGAPLWTVPLPPALLPSVAVATSSRGEIYVCGAGKTALVVFDLGPDGRYGVTRTATRAATKLGEPGGVTLLEAMLLPVPGREGWVPEDRFVALTDRKQAALVVFDAQTLRRIGSAAIATEVQGVAPGRLDISNRGQVAVVDMTRAAAHSLPTRVLASVLENAGIRWRRIGPAGSPDSTAARDSTATRP